ncbi:hypothetical protein B0J15DRAFT_468349 [Fusarium solani]|uniref:Transmembrane protein n=1 Tax=Fusarium solani TaxID=169388 RepID=A0A9P9K3X1_FUSSL|nr:uncharacterized protein B0J15DRAFT_468349 [Fusarium solani]KAH7248337.1 hypothetical protein B0J15DRAFT_468349 [Fusarium solani]
MPVIDLPLFKVRCFGFTVAFLALEILILIVCLSTFQHPLVLALSSLMPLTTHVVAVSVAWTFYYAESGMPDEEAGTISSHQREHRSTLFAVACVGSAVVIFTILLLTLSTAGVLHPSLFTQGLLCLTISLQLHRNRPTGDHFAIIPHDFLVTRSSATDPPARSSISQPDTITRISSFQPLEPILDTTIVASISGNRETRRYT